MLRRRRTRDTCGLPSVAVFSCVCCKPELAGLVNGGHDFVEELGQMHDVLPQSRDSKRTLAQHTLEPARRVPSFKHDTQHTAAVAQKNPPRAKAAWVKLMLDKFGGHLGESRNEIAHCMEVSDRFGRKRTLEGVTLQMGVPTCG